MLYFLVGAFIGFCAGTVCLGLFVGDCPFCREYEAEVHRLQTELSHFQDQFKVT